MDDSRSAGHPRPVENWRTDDLDRLGRPAETAPSRDGRRRSGGVLSHLHPFAYDVPLRSSPTYPCRVASDHPDHGGRCRARDAAADDLRRCAAPAARARRRPRDLLRRASPLHREQRCRRAPPAASPSPAAGPTAPAPARSPRRTAPGRAAPPPGRAPPSRCRARARRPPPPGRRSARSSGSTRVTVRSGRPIARTSPGQAGTRPEVGHARPLGDQRREQPRS